MTLTEIISAIGIEPYHQEPAGVIYCCDCLDILPRIPEESIDLVLTDPPYNEVNRDTNGLRIAVRGKTIDVRHIFTFHLWDYTGRQSLYQTLFRIEKHSDPIPSEIIQEINKATEEFSHGNLNCSDCGKSVGKETRNRYFAGTYCDDCWLGRSGKHKDKGGWQKIEAQETYD